MSESEPSSVGLFAFPISDPPLRFHTFLYEYGHELGRAGGSIVHWRPIGDPARCDAEYIRVRTAALAKRDQEDSEKFRKEAQRLGSEEWLCRGEYEQYATNLGVKGIAPPLVVFTAPPLTKKALLKFEPIVFDRAEWTRELADILTRNITEEVFSKLREGGVFTDKIFERVQRNLWHVSEEIFRIYTSPRRKLPKHLKYSVSGLLVNDHVDTGQETRLRWWLRKDGSLAIDTVTSGKTDGTVEFRLFNGTATMQQRLMMLLLHKHPAPVALIEVIHELYPHSVRGLRKSAEKMGKSMNNVRAHVHAIRRKLDEHGMPKEIIPSVPLIPSSDNPLRLNVSEVLRAEGEYLDIRNPST